MVRKIFYKQKIGITGGVDLLIASNAVFNREMSLCAAVSFYQIPKSTFYLTL